MCTSLFANLTPCSHLPVHLLHLTDVFQHSACIHLITHMPITPISQSLTTPLIILCNILYTLKCMTRIFEECTHGIHSLLQTHTPTFLTGLWYTTDPITPCTLVFQILILRQCLNIASGQTQILQSIMR